MVKRNPPERKRELKMTKRPESILTKKMKIPGMPFFKDDLIQGNTPLSDGVYMVYYEFESPNGWSRTKETAAVGIATFSEGRWGLNRKVFAYMGPIPCMPLMSLKEIDPPYLINQTFFIATLYQAANLNYRCGPFPQYMLAFLTRGNKGDFIFCLDTENISPYPISKLTINSDGDGKFKDLSPDAGHKYTKMMNHLRKKKW